MTAFLQPITRQRAELMHTVLKDEGVPWSFVLARYNVKRAGELTHYQSCEILEQAGSGRLKKAFLESE